MLSGDGDEVEKKEERLQVRDYLNRGTIDRVRVSTGVEKDGTRGNKDEGRAKQDESY